MRSKKQYADYRKKEREKADRRRENRKKYLRSLSDEEKQEIKDLIQKTLNPPIFHNDIEIVDLPYIVEQEEEVEVIEQEEDKELVIDLLEGLTEAQKTIVKFLVEKHNFNPMGFDVYVKENRILYFKNDIFTLLSGGIKTAQEIRTTHPLTPKPISI
jgi:hypothetical protein